MIKPFKFFHGYVDDWTLDFVTTTRRIMGRTILTDIVPVQPMDGPTGRIFYMDYQYNNNETI